MEIATLPLLILNLVSGILGGIWLAVLGEWNVVVVGIVLTLCGKFLVSLLLMPSLILLAPFFAIKKLAESVFVAVPLTILSVTYTYFVMGLWAIGIFWYFSKQVNENAAIPVVFWSYSIATAVWSYLARFDEQSGNHYSGMSNFFYQIGCVSLMIYTYRNFHNVEFYSMAIWFAVPMAVGLIVHVPTVIATVKAEQHFQ